MCLLLCALYFLCFIIVVFVVVYACVCFGLRFWLLCCVCLLCDVVFCCLLLLCWCMCCFVVFACVVCV
jgi:hypothetical protein